jgi:hypothetical protein
MLRPQSLQCNLSFTVACSLLWDGRCTSAGVGGIGGEVATHGDDQKVKSATTGKNKKTGGNNKGPNNQTSPEEMNTLAYRLQEGNTQSHLSEVLDLSIAFR